MTFPFESLSTTAASWGLVVALILGFAFGFVLERAGFGRATKLAGQFYLTDMTVFKVMFSAILVAMLGLVITGGLGVADLQGIIATGASFTFLWPMVVGGLLLGVGFIISGYCPGTSIVGAASGNIDGLFTVLGVVAGSLLFGELYWLLGDFAGSSNLGHLLLPDLVGVPHGVVAGAIAIIAIGAFLGADWVEGRFGPPPDQDSTASRRRNRRIAFGLFASGGAVAAALAFQTTAAPPAPGGDAQSLNVETLAHRLTTEPWRLRVVDLRGEGAWAKARIPHSEPVDRNNLAQLGLHLTEGGSDLIVVDQREPDRLPPELASYGGRVFTLAGGFPAWQRFALKAPPPLEGNPSSEDRKRYLFRAALYGYATGRAAAAPPPRPRRAVTAPRATGGGGCT